jgi:hypothetical protein
MEKGSINGQTVAATWAGTMKIKRMALVYIFGQMAEGLRVSGVKANEMAPAKLFTLPVSKNTVSGSTTKEKTPKQ